MWSLLVDVLDGKEGYRVRFSTELYSLIRQTASLQARCGQAQAYCAGIAGGGPALSSPSAQSDLGTPHLSDLRSWGQNDPQPLEVKN